MASPWITYTPHPPPPQHVQTSNLADNSHTVPSELAVSDASLVSIDSAKRQALGRAGRNPSVSSIPPFNSTGGSHTESTGKAAPILVSATSFGFEFREAGLSTRTSVDKQHTSALLQAPHSPMSNDGERYAPTTSEGADSTAMHVAGPIPLTHKHVGPQSSLSSSTFERDLFASSPTKNTHAAAPISAAENATPPSPPESSTPYAVTTGDVSITDSPNTGALSQTPTVKLSLTQSPEHGRGKSERQPPRRLGTGGSAGSGSAMQSRYADMVFEDVPRTHNLLSGLFTWILLAGFVVLPGTFSALEGIQNKSGEFEKVLHTIHHLPLCVHFFRPEFTLLTLSVQTSNRFRLLRPRRVWDVVILVALGTQLRLVAQQHFRPRDAQRPLRGAFDVRQHIRCAGWRIWRFKYRHSGRYRGMHHCLWFSDRDLLALEAGPCQASTSTRDGTNERCRRCNGRGPILLVQWLGLRCYGQWQSVFRLSPDTNLLTFGGIEI